MGYISALWYMMSGTALAMGLVHLLVWMRRRREWHLLMFGVSAIGIAGLAVAEVHMMTASSIAEMVRWLHFGHVPVFFVLIGLVAFVQTRFGTGRLWLAATVIALRLVVLLVSLFSEVNANYLRIDSLATVQLFGEPVTMVGAGVTNPWTRVASLSLVLFIVYVADASIRLVRRGDRVARRRAALVGGSIILTLFFAGVTSGLKHEGLVTWPYVNTPAYLFILMAIGYELAADVMRAAELARRLSVAEQRIQLAAEAAGVGIWEWRRARGELWLSDTARGLLGFGPAEAVSADRFFDRLEHDGAGSVRADIERAESDRREFDTVARLAGSRQEARWFALRGGVTADRPQQPSVVRGVMFDITERQEAEHRLRTIAEGSPNAVMMVDAQGRIVFCNDRAQTLFGYAATELLGKAVEMLVPAAAREHHPAHRRDFDSDRASGMMRPGAEVHALTKDGSEIPVEVWLTHVRLNDEQLVLVNVIDVRARRNAELALARQRYELAHLSRVATMGELSGSLAHELNQPLTAILTNAQAAQRMRETHTLDDAMLDEILQDVVDDSKRAGEVIRRLRAFMRRGEFEREPLDINTVVLDVLRLLHSDLIGRRVLVETELAPSLARVAGDRVQLQQVLLNLILNGCDAMESMARPRKLVIRTESDAGAAVRVSVIDRGSGIASEHLRTVFDPFVTTKAGGMGLGLSVCRTIVEQHGGSIGARNNPDAGATFHFTLPALPAASA